MKSDSHLKVAAIVTEEDFISDEGEMFDEYEHLPKAMD